MAVTFQNLIDMFLAGETQAVSGSRNYPGTLKIIDDQIIHYRTPILERYNKKFIINITRYSIQTGMVQKRIKESIPEEQLITVKHVPIGTCGSLKSFLDN